MKHPVKHTGSEQLNLDNTETFKRIYHELQPQVYLFVKSLLNDAEIAKDISAETFLKLWNRKEKFESLEKVKAFLFITSKNATLDYLKHSRTLMRNESNLLHSLTAGEEILFEEAEIKAEVFKFIRRAIDALPDRSREVFILSYIHGLNVREIASQLNVSLQTVNNQKSTALKAIRITVLKKRWLLTVLIFLYKKLT